MKTISSVGGHFRKADEGPSSNHIVQFYEDENFFHNSVNGFVSAGLEKGDGVIVVASDMLCEHLGQSLATMGHNISEVKQKGQYIVLDAEDTLSKIMVESLPDRTLFQSVIGGLLDRVSSSHPSIRVYGEMVNVLCAKGNFNGAMALEGLWNNLLKERSFLLFCGYTLKNFGKTTETTSFKDVCDSHQQVIPVESYLEDKNDDKRRLIAELQQKALALQEEILERRTLESVLRKNESELREAKEKAEKANMTLNDFLANLSQEARTPLVAILGYAEMMLDHQKSAKEKLEYSRIILQNGKNLTRMLDDLLSILKK